MFNSWHLLQQSTDFCDTSEKVTLLENPESPLFLPGMKKKRKTEITNGEKNTDKIIIKPCFFHGTELNKQKTLPLT